MATKRSQIGLGGAGLGDATLRDMLGKMVLAFDFTDVPAADDNQIVTSKLGNAAGLELAIADATPDVPRNLTATFGATWDAGDITVHGYDQFGNAISEVLADNPGSEVVGSKCFKSVTHVFKQAVGTTTGTVIVGTGVKLGISMPVRAPIHVFSCDGVSETGTLDATNCTVTATTTPNAAHDYKLLVSPA